MGISNCFHLWKTESVCLTKMTRGTLLVALFLVSGISALLSGVGKLPSFSWGDSSDDELHVVNLNVEFNDGLLPDVAMLTKVVNPDLDPEEEEKNNECILTGWMRDEDNIDVTVSGCPGADSYQVIMHSPRLSSNIFDVENGVVSVHRPYPNQPAGDDEVLGVVDAGEMRNWDISMRQVTDRDLPSSFSVSIALRYDNLFLQNTCGGDHTVAQARAREIVTLAQAFYRDSATLGTTITLGITSIKHVDASLRLVNVGTTCGPSCTMNQVIDTYTAADSEDVDNFHYLSQDTNSGTSGIAKQMMYTNVGWTYMGTVCWPSKKLRTAITEVFGPTTNSWNSLRVDAAETFAHELGHSLGMPHDFTDSSNPNNSPRADSSGNSCLNVDGIMSYKNVDKTTWSTCSKEAITGWFAQLSKSQMNCKGENACEDLCKTGSTSCPLSAMICDNPSSFGGCTGQYKGYFDQYCKLTCEICSGNGSSDGGTEPETETCRDQCGAGSTDCPISVLFCNNSVYGGCNGGNAAYYAKYCKKECSLC